MSGDPRLRYGTSIGWTLVPPLADEDDDSVELPSTVDVKAIQDSPQPADGAPHPPRPPSPPPQSPPPPPPSPPPSPPMSQSPASPAAPVRPGSLSSRSASPPSSPRPPPPERLLPTPPPAPTLVPSARGRSPAVAPQPAGGSESSSDGNESDIDSDSWSSGSGGQDSESESCGWSDVTHSGADDGAPPPPGLAAAPLTTASLQTGGAAGPRPLSVSDDSEFEVSVLGGVRAALQSLEDDADTAERVTTPEKQTWWKIKLKQTAASRAETSQSLVRPWESSRNGLRLAAAGKPISPPAASPAASSDGERPGSGQHSSGWELSSCPAPPPATDAHLRKPSLSEILNLENKNSHLRGTSHLRNGNYDSTSKVRKGDYDGAPKLPHQLRASEESSDSRPLGRPRPSPSAPPPRRAADPPSPRSRHGRLRESGPRLRATPVPRPAPGPAPEPRSPPWPDDGEERRLSPASCSYQRSPSRSASPCWACWAAAPRRRPETADSEAGSETSRRPHAISLSRRKRIKLLKRKHKNIVDPVLLADVEELVRKLNSLVILRGPGRPTYESRPPTCFQTRKYGRRRKQLPDKATRTERQAPEDRERKAKKEPPPPPPPPPTSPRPSPPPPPPPAPQPAQEDETKEQCLPLKKRYHQMSQAVSEAASPQKLPIRLSSTAPGADITHTPRATFVQTPRIERNVAKVMDKPQSPQKISLNVIENIIPAKTADHKLVSCKASEKCEIAKTPNNCAISGLAKTRSEMGGQKQSAASNHTQSDAVNYKQSAVPWMSKCIPEISCKAGHKEPASSEQIASAKSIRLLMKEPDTDVAFAISGSAADHKPTTGSVDLVGSITADSRLTDHIRLPKKSDEPSAGEATEEEAGSRRWQRSRRPAASPSQPSSRRLAAVASQPAAERPAAPSQPPAERPAAPSQPPSRRPMGAPSQPPSRRLAAPSLPPAERPAAPSQPPAERPAALPVLDAPPAPAEAEDRAAAADKSPPDAAALVVRRNKRRKINRTGFPNKKRKVRPKSTPSTPELEAAAPGTPPDSPKAAVLAVATGSAESWEPSPSDGGRMPPAASEQDGPQLMAPAKRSGSRAPRRRRRRPGPSQLHQTPVVRLDKISERPPSEAFPASATAAGTATHRKRRRDASAAPSKRSRADCPNIAPIEDDLYCESDMLVSESGPSSEVASGDELHRPATVFSRSRLAAPSWKKKRYITAGLFSDFYKVASECERPEVTKSRLSYEPAEHRFGLLPPPCYEERWLRQRARHFTLPYDLWWLQAHGQLPGRHTLASWNYRKLRTNFYFDVKPPPPREVEACSCRLPMDPQRAGCGDDCINRMMFVECSGGCCPCGERCDNQRIQRHRWSPGLVKFMTGEKGWGILTKRAIRAGSFILEYVGEIVSEKEFKRRMQTRYANDQHHYCLNLDRGLVIDGHRMGSIGRFVNHSCSPNCEMQKWEVNGLHRMALFSLEEIPAGTELTYDYNFSLFNPAVGQRCRCGSVSCRGVIGGRSQRLAGPPAEPADLPQRHSASPEPSLPPPLPPPPQPLPPPPVRPLSGRDVRFIRLHRSFLVRNYEKMRRQREPPLEAGPPSEPGRPPAAGQEETFRAQLRALESSRSVRTRRLAAAEEDPQRARTVRLAHLLQEIHQAVLACHGQRPGEPTALEALTLSGRRRRPAGSLLPEPLDITQIGRHIVTGQYRTAEAFDHDMRRLFTAQLRVHGRCSPTGAAVLRLKHKYAECKTVMMSQLQEVLGITPSCFRPPAKRRQDSGLDGEEDTIRCVCNLHREEGLMIQCERCLVWQHCDCVDADTSVEHYACEVCEPRHLSPEVRLKPQPEDAEPGLTYYLALMRDQLQVRQGDCVYILQGHQVKAAQQAGVPPYKYVTQIVPDELLIFRVEKLWKDESGSRFAFGYHYCRPQETYHEPTRKFFTKEVMRSPLYEVVPLELVVGTCWVLDVNTYCKGRPVGANEQSVYVCEYRVDKTARLFAKLTKNRHPICTKAFAFDAFETRLKISRTFTPHAEEVAQKMNVEKVKGRRKEEGKNNSLKSTKSRTARDSVKHAPLPLKVETPEEKYARRSGRLEAVLLRLLTSLPGPPVDASHLFGAGKRGRRRPTPRL